MPILRPTNKRAVRTYTGAGGSEVPSVTEVLRVLDGTWMNAWIQKAGRKEVDRVMNEAAVLGTKIHKVASTVALDRNARVSAEMRPYARAVREFMDTHVRRVIFVERSMCSERLGFGGTCDLYAELQDGSLAVVDYKSSSGGVTKIHKLQTAAYAMLLQEAGWKVHKRLVVRLHKADDRVGEWYARAALDHRRDIETFKACVTVWNFLHGSKLNVKEEVA